MQAWIIKYCTFKACLRVISFGLAVEFILFGLDFMVMAMPYLMFAAILAFTLLAGLIAYIGFIVRIIYLWPGATSENKLDDGTKIFALTVILAFSAFLSLGMVLPTWNYPR